jgi:hypothetical protein
VSESVTEMGRGGVEYVSKVPESNVGHA